MNYLQGREEELKYKIAQTYFPDLDCTAIIGNIDFCVKPPLKHNQQLLLTEYPAFLWAEAKRGQADLIAALVQLILTIGKAKTFNKHLPPPFLAAFDGHKIAFILYNSVHEIFYQNDFNWKVAPSNHKTREFKQIYETVKSTLEQTALTFYFGKDNIELHSFIEQNFKLGQVAISRIRIDKNNFTVIYDKWLELVKPSIAVNWNMVKKQGIIDGDFYLADLLSKDNETLKEKLYVLLKRDYYQLDQKIDPSGLFSFKTTSFQDSQKAHRLFWNKYERPPSAEYWDYIVKRRDLLVPQDVRERKGSFFTPKIWVELSQKYIAELLGEDWQDDYFVWDCAAGTGNLLAGLTNKYHIYASTLDQQDVDVMHDRIKNGANLLESHVFQFDFLNDDFSKLPPSLRTIVEDPEKRRKLVVYINPPYVEGDARIGKGRKGTQLSKVHQKYQVELGKASGELFAQFFMRIYKELHGCFLAGFSTLKILQAPNFKTFRQHFLAELKKIFVAPAFTFDNVKGQFPIGFMIWNTNLERQFKFGKAAIYDKNNHFLGSKNIYCYDGCQYISHLIQESKERLVDEFPIGNLSSIGNDFQHQNALFINSLNRQKIAGGRHTTITNYNLIEVAVYFTVRKCIKATWLNDRDQFLYPNEAWQTDTEFQNDCLTYALFTNNIESCYDTNHWIPFTESEVEAQDRFESHFMTDFIAGKFKSKDNNGLHQDSKISQEPLSFSASAQAVFGVGRALWTYYHSQPACNVNASLYDIKEYFQGRTKMGRLKSKGSDDKYNTLLNQLRKVITDLGKAIQPKIYQYGFLK